MLEVYMDRKVAIAFVNTFGKAKNEPDLSKRMRLMKIESFIKLACILKLENTFKEFNKQLLPFFTQGVGEHSTISFEIFDEIGINKNKCAIAILDKENPLFQIVSKENLTIQKEKFQDELTSLMFNSPEQTIKIPIIPEGIYRNRKNVDSFKTFNGWNTFLKHPLVAMTDVIIIDSYFLKPKGSNYVKTDFLVKAYIRNSLLPLFKILIKYSLDNHLTVNIFTEWNEDYESIARDLFDQLELILNENNLNIDLLFVVSENLNEHKRILYTNYFALRTELSLHQFQTDKVTGSRKDDVIINPFAVDNLSDDPHNSMMVDLADLFLKFTDNRSRVIGKRSNLSPMLIQAHNQLNPNKP